MFPSLSFLHKKENVLQDSLTNRWHNTKVKQSANSEYMKDGPYFSISLSESTSGVDWGSEEDSEEESNLDWRGEALK